MQNVSATPSEPAPEFDLTDAPFSRWAYWLSLSTRPATGQNAVYLQTKRGRVIHRTLLRLELWKNDCPQETVLLVSAGCLRLEAKDGAGLAEFVISEDSTVLARVSGTSLRISMEPQPYSSSIPVASQRWHLNFNAAHTRLMIHALEGKLTGLAPFIPGKSDTEPVLLTLTPEANGSAQAAITEFESSWVPSPHPVTFDCARQAAEKEFENWFSAFRFPATANLALARRAAFVLWSNTAPAGGNYAAPPIMMSQNSMAAIWSWDHCFNTLALAKAHPGHAWDQWWLPFSLQTPEGMLPDGFTDSSVDFGMTKPPIHGWTLLKTLPYLNLTNQQLAMAHDALARWTAWWLAHRDDDGDGIAQYNHGCESGWDNDSLCSCNIPSESLDLTVYLIQQYEALAELSRRMGQPAQAAHWMKKADDLYGRFQKHSFLDGAWQTLHSGSHQRTHRGDCLRQFWPLLLGSRLHKEQIDHLLEELLKPGRFRTAYGFATESPASPCYVADGYWLGPIWAPSTVQVVEMLQLHGKPQEACEAARLFCDLCSTKGFNENFDALAGRGLRDRGYAWTAAACLYFLQTAGS